MSGGSEENPHAGKGSSVLLDIGEDVGALVVTMPAELEGVEIELRGRGHDHGHGHAHWPHVAVVPRPSPAGELIQSAVFFEVPAGSYELYVRPDGPVQLTVDIRGGHVTQADWPSWPTSGDLTAPGAPPDAEWASGGAPVCPGTCGKPVAGPGARVFHSRQPTRPTSGPPTSLSTSASRPTERRDADASHVHVHQGRDLHLRRGHDAWRGR